MAYHLKTKLKKTSFQTSVLMPGFKPMTSGQGTIHSKKLSATRLFNITVVLGRVEELAKAPDTHPRDPGSNRGSDRQYIFLFGLCHTHYFGSH